jgi:hypothetical protein
MMRRRMVPSLRNSNPSVFSSPESRILSLHLDLEGGATCQDCRSPSSALTLRTQYMSGSPHGGQFHFYRCSFYPQGIRYLSCERQHRERDTRRAYVHVGFHIVGVCVTGRHCALTQCLFCLGIRIRSDARLNRDPWPSSASCWSVPANDADRLIGREHLSRPGSINVTRRRI